MSRAKWKGPFVNLKLLNITGTEIMTKARNITIIPKFVGLKIKIYNGKTYNELLVNDKMIGHKLGEFSPTRKKFSFKKKK